MAVARVQAHKALRAAGLVPDVPLVPVTKPKGGRAENSGVVKRGLRGMALRRKQDQDQASEACSGEEDGDVESDGDAADEEES